MSESELEVDDEPKEPPEKHDGFVALDLHLKDVNNQHKKFRDEERGRLAAEKKATDLSQELTDLREKNVDLTIPDIPDQYADDYAEKIALRDAAIKRNTEHETEEKRLTEDKKRNDEVIAEKAEEANKAQVAVFDKNMVDLGVTSEVVAVQQKVVAYGVSDNLTDLILQHPEGPLLLMYLAENPVEHGEMNVMSTYQLFEHFNSNVKAKAALLKPKTSNAPNPPIVPTGGGVPELQEDWEKGVVYD